MSGLDTSERTANLRDSVDFFEGALTPRTLSPMLRDFLALAPPEDQQRIVASVDSHDVFDLSTTPRTQFEGEVLKDMQWH